MNDNKYTADNIYSTTKVATNKITTYETPRTTTKLSSLYSQFNKNELESSSVVASSSSSSSNSSFSFTFYLSVFSVLFYNWLSRFLLDAF